LRPCEDNWNTVDGWTAAAAAVTASKKIHNGGAAGNGDFSRERAICINRNVPATCGARWHPSAA